MGLPLFVAPVESDLPSKTADKSRATSPSRSAIRRHVRPDSRGRRHMARRHGAISERINALNAFNAMRPSAPPGDWTEPGYAPNNETSNGQGTRTRPPRFQDALRELARSDDRRRGANGEGLNSMFGFALQDDDDSARADANRLDFDVDWSTFESRRRLARNRNVTTQPNRSDSALRSTQRESAPRSLDSLFAEQRRRIERRIRDTTTDRSDWEEQQRLLRIHALNRPREVGGLGDRDRSLSPEVWDTLLTTLTPDPQPPSAGSSFASTAASQNAGASSSTSLTTPDTANEAYLVDPGCDNSDTEGPQYEYEAFYLPRREPSRRVRLRVPQRIVDGPADGQGRASSNDRDGSADPAAPASRPQRTTEDLMVAAAVSGDGSLSFSHLRGQRHGWVGQLSVGTSDDEQGTDRRSLNREGSTASANLTSQGEDDWLGMQRIVRSLARREDIPDEWWAEAGLSRTLPQDGTE